MSPGLNSFGYEYRIALVGNEQTCPVLWHEGCPPRGGMGMVPAAGGGQGLPVYERLMAALTAGITFSAMSSIDRRPSALSSQSLPA